MRPMDPRARSVDSPSTLWRRCVALSVRAALALIVAALALGSAHPASAAQASARVSSQPAALLAHNAVAKIQRVVNDTAVYQRAKASTGPAPEMSRMAACPIGNAVVDAGTVWYTVNSNNSTGASVTVHFNVTSGCTPQKISLVAYTAPGSTFDRNTAYLQAVYNSSSYDSSISQFTTGWHSLSVIVPACFYQVDLVSGDVIQHLGPAHSTNFYGDQGRLIAHANGGSFACPVVTDTPTNTPTKTPTNTPTKTPTNTPTKSPTATLTGTATRTTTPTMTPTGTVEAPQGGEACAYGYSPGYWMNPGAPVIAGLIPYMYFPTGTSASALPFTAANVTTDINTTAGSFNEFKRHFMASELDYALAKQAGLDTSGYLYQGQTLATIFTDAYTAYQRGSLDTSNAADALASGFVNYFANDPANPCLITHVTPATGTPTKTETPTQTATGTTTSTGTATKTATGTPTGTTTTAVCPTGAAAVMQSSVYYTVNKNGVRIPISINGHVNQGDTVTVYFKVAAGCSNITVSFVGYKAPWSTWNANTADQQTVTNYQSGTFSAGGPYQLTVVVPSCFYQLDFVTGMPITTLGPVDTNPNNFYHNQGNFIDGANGGTTACPVTPPPPPCDAIHSPAYYLPGGGYFTGGVTSLSSLLNQTIDFKTTTIVSATSILQDTSGFASKLPDRG